MPKNWKAILTTPLNGLTLSTLFFYPLLTALSGENINLLHWALIDSVETISSWIFIGILFLYVRVNVHMLVIEKYRPRKFTFQLGLLVIRLMHFRAEKERGRK